MQTVDNTQDIIDSRDVIARIDELRDERAALTDDEQVEWDESDEGCELFALESLQEEAESSPDWEFGEQLIRDSYFKEYAQSFAEDIGAVKSDATWPNNCIDWDEAADMLTQDYFSVEFVNVTYWIRK